MSYPEISRSVIKCLEMGTAGIYRNGLRSKIFDQLQIRYKPVSIYSRGAHKMAKNVMNWDKMSWNLNSLRIMFDMPIRVGCNSRRIQPSEWCISDAPSVHRNRVQHNSGRDNHLTNAGVSNHYNGGTNYFNYAPDQYWPHFASRKWWKDGLHHYHLPHSGGIYGVYFNADSSVGHVFRDTQNSTIFYDGAWS